MQSRWNSEPLPPGEGAADDIGLLPAILQLDCRTSGEPASELSADHVLKHLAAQHEIGGQLRTLVPTGRLFGLTRFTRPNQPRWHDS